MPVENTYRLAPDNSDIFNPCKVSNALEVLLSVFLASKSYSPVQSPRLVCDLTARILARAKKWVSANTDTYPHLQCTHFYR